MRNFLFTLFFTIYKILPLGLQKRIKQRFDSFCIHSFQKKQKKPLQIIQETECKLSYESSSVKDMNIVVYTCITGGYEPLRNPLYLEKNISYVLLTDDLKAYEGLQSHWDLRPVPKNILSMYKDNTLVNRYVKMHPNELFPSYDYAIYIDGNISIISDISYLLSQINNRSGMAMHQHSARRCAYQEAKTCIMMQKGSEENIKRQMMRYKKEGFPHKYGLLEASVVVFDLHNEISKKISSMWWNEFYNSKSYRDQLSLPYLIWKLGLSVDDVGTLGNNIMKNPKFSRLPH